MKTCFKCQKEQPLTEFYRHLRMRDGHLNKCKTCAKRDVHVNYVGKRERYSEYERKRFRDPARKEKLKKYAATQRVTNRHKNLARQAVIRAVRSGQLVRRPCVVCGNPKSQAHHADYTKPLDVVWY